MGAAAPTSSAAPRPRPPSRYHWVMTRSTVWRLVPALGLTQIVSWGTLYYSIAVLGASMREELGISAAMLFGAYSLALLISALTAPFVGRAIDRHGGRVVMSLGSVAAALALFLIAHVHSTIALAFNGFIVSVLTVHLITILQGKGLTLATAVWVGTFFGPMQVTGRLLEFSIGRRFASRSIGIAALSLLVVAVVVLLALNGQIVLALLFAILFGGSNGVVTIVRGTVPAELFGRAGYGGTLGNLAAPALFARAIAPFAFAPLAVAESAMVAGLLVLLAMAALSVASFGFAVKRR